MGYRKGAYVETEYIAGGAVAAQVKGGWNITVKDENGDEQTIFIPSSATMGYMDVLNGANPMHALYGINEKDVEYGPAKKTLKKGFVHQLLIATWKLWLILREQMLLLIHST